MKKDSKGIQKVCLGDRGYPQLLAAIKNPPKELYCIGDISLLGSRCVSVVGSRTTTVYGRKTAETIGSRLAQRGITVVSGMASGIDTCAHKGALSVHGSTIAVLGCGPDICYPAENETLKKEIEQRGLIISEYKPGTLASRFNFPVRNRIIAGLSEMTVVVQARNRSGALITAELAAEQGREVCAVPGNIDSQYNLGNNKLLRDGARPIVSIDDIFLPLNMVNVDLCEAEGQLSPAEFEILKVIKDHGEMSADEISFYVGMPPAYINPILSVIEMKGFIFSEAGKFFLANA